MRTSLAPDARPDNGGECEAYYKDYAQSHPGILRAAWGFTVETATQGLAGLRLACANARTETAA